MVKSSIDDLKKRGFISNLDINEYIHLSQEELKIMITSQKAYERTIAVRLLCNGDHISQTEASNILLEMLVKEESLYTKLEICNVLERGGIKTANSMIAFLGKIGNNQHHSLPTNVSKKKSYPLPRDIIARTLGKMDTEVLPVLIEALDTKDMGAIREVIDAIGFMCFYSPVSNGKRIIEKLLLCFHTYNDDEVIRWKIVMAFSAFHDESIAYWLANISKTDVEELIRNEAKRSLELICRREL